MSTLEVQQASERFYAALTRLVNGDVAPMSNAWSHEEQTSVMHPIGGRQIGWDAIESSWRQVANLASEGQVDLTGRKIEIMGEVAIETGVEQGRSRLSGRTVTFENRVTNIYRRGADGWKMIHHHADVSPAMVEVIQGSSSTSD